MSNSVTEDDDVLQLLTAEVDEFDADIDEDAEEELLRDDIINDGKQSMVSQKGGQNLKSLVKESMDDEEEDDDKDSGRRGRFRSERIMSLASVPTRRREIPDSLESVNVNSFDKKSSDNSYNNRRHNQQKYRNSGNGLHNRHNSRQNKGLLPLPPQQSHPQPIGQHSQHIEQYLQHVEPHSQPIEQHSQPIGQHSQPIEQHSHPQQRMVLIQPNIYGQQMQTNPNPMNTIHVNPHFRARMANQYEQHSQNIRPSEPQMRLPANPMIQSRPPFPTQTVNNSQQMMFNQQMNQQIRPQFMANNPIFNEQNMPQMNPQFQSQPQQQPLIAQQPPFHQMQMDSQWSAVPNVPQFPMQHNLGQLMTQPMPLNRQLNTNPMNSMMNNTPQQQNYTPNQHSFHPNYHSNQPLLMAPMTHPTVQIGNNFNSQYQPMESQRFPTQQNYNQMMFRPNPQTFQSQSSQQMFNNNNSNQMSSQLPQMVVSVNKRGNTNSQSVPTVRPNKPLVGQQRSSALKATQMATKHAKQFLNKKQNVVKEVPIVSNTVFNKNKSQSVDTEMEAAVGVDEEYKRKMEDQKRIREEVLRQKAERRKAMVAQKQRASEVRPTLQTVRPTVEHKLSPLRSQPQQQIATLVNRSPQLSQTSKQMPKRLVKAITNDNNSKPIVNRVVLNLNQKKSVLIRGLTASTTELAVRKLCKTIGPIESCHIESSGGQKVARVTFMRSQDAILFQSKHERSLLDLSIIQNNCVNHMYEDIG